MWPQGMRDLVELHWLKMFAADELGLLLSGTPSVDVAV